MKWFKATEKLPAHNGDVLVWTGRRFFVSSAYIYSKEERDLFASWAAIPPKFMQDMTEKQKQHYLECKGYFEDCFDKFYLDNPNVMWQELPEKPNG